MCVVSVDFQYLMLPADKGMKLVELLQSAVRVEPEYRDRDYSYQVGDQPSVEYKSVKASQVRMPNRGGSGTADRPTSIGSMPPLALKG